MTWGWVDDGWTFILSEVIFRASFFGIRLGWGADPHISPLLCWPTFHTEMMATEELSESRHGEYLKEMSRRVKQVIVIHHGHGWMALWGLILKKKKKDSKETDIPHLFELFWWRSEFLERLYPSRIQICGAGIVMNALASKAQGWFERTWCDGTFNNSTTTSCHSIRCNFWWFHRSVSGSNCRSWRKIFKLS